MSQLFQIRLPFICTALFVSTVFYACDKDTSISLGNAKEDFGVVTVDSMTVFTSTYQLLNMPSAGTKVVLVGKSSQENIGSVTSSSYLNLIYDAASEEIPNNATFDSVNVVLRPVSSRYYYGDTTKNQSISIHRILEDLKTKNISTILDNSNTPVYVTGANIFNNQKFAYENSPLGTSTFAPRVKSLDSLSVRLSDSFGKELYDKIVQKDLNVSTNEYLIKYFKGIVIVPGSENTTVLGLNDTVYLNLNYSYVGSDGFVKKGKKSLVSTTNNLQYNNIEYDRSGTAYASINDNNRSLSSTATDGKVLLQAGTGLVAKLNIPSLNDFINDENIAVNKIELIVETTGHNYGYYPNPTALMLLIENSNGVPFSYVTTPFTNTIQSAPFTIGNEFGGNPTYVFNLIDYIKNINSTTYKGSSLLLTASSSGLFNTVNAAFIATENGKPKIKLNIVYTKFK